MAAARKRKRKRTSGGGRKRRTAKQKAATRRMIAGNRAARGGGTRKRRSTKKRKGSRARSGGGGNLAARVSRLERGHKILAKDVAIIHSVTTGITNAIRAQYGRAPIKKLPGYVSPLGARALAPGSAMRQLGAGR